MSHDVRRAIVALWLAGFVPLGACATSPEQLAEAHRELLQPARRALQAGDDVRAFQLYSGYAERGITEARYMLGRLYDEGRGTPQDSAQAAPAPRFGIEPRP